MVKIDKLFEEIDLKTGEFAFDENVARVFDDMISRSIPLYADVQRAAPVLADLLDHDPIKVIDLGCSTGTSLIHLAKSLPGRNLELIGVDNSEPMLAKCREKIAAAGAKDETLKQRLNRIAVCQDDICSFEFESASVVLMNYTLQFVDTESRPGLLSRICNSLRPGGFLMVSEKVIHEEPAVDDALIELYFEYKRRQGYSELEISRKRDALENVLVPLTIEDNQELIRESGFGRVEVLLKWFNFATFVCYR